VDALLRRRGHFRGTFSVGAVPLMGIGFMWIGTLALATPAAWADAWMALASAACTWASVR